MKFAPHSDPLTITPQDTRRNFQLGVANGVLYNFAETLLDPTLVLVAFLSHLTQSPLLLGLVVPLRDGSWSLPQLWISTFLQSYSRKITLYQRTSVLRIIAWGFLALTINFVRDRSLLLVLFFTAFLLSSLASGTGGLPYLEVVGKTIPPERRGEFFAWRLGIGGFLSIGGSLFVRWILDPANPLQFPYNYGLLSFLFFVLASISLLIFNQIKELPTIEPLPPNSLLTQIRRSKAMLGSDKNYRRLIIMISLLLVAASATPFFAVYVQQELGGSKAMVGTYLGVVMATNLAANILFGKISRQLGNRIVMIAAASAGVIMSTIMVVLTLAAKPANISATAASLILIPVFIFSGLRGTGFSIAENSLLLDIAPEEERSLYLGFTNTFLGIVLVLSGLSGFFLAWVGFTGLFLLTLGFHAMGLFLALRVMQPNTPSTSTNNGQQ